MSTSPRSLSSKVTRHEPAGPRQRARGALLALGLTLLLPPTALRAGRLMPDRSATASMQVSGRVIDVTQRGVRIRVEPLDTAQVTEWFRTRTRSGRASLNLEAALLEPDDGSGEAPKPRARTRAAQPLMVFALSIENGSGDDVTYIPAMTSIFESGTPKMS